MAIVISISGFVVLEIGIVILASTDKILLLMRYY